MTLTLRGYQVDVVNRARERMRRSGRRGIIQGETGSGKTLIGAELCRLALGLGKRVLILADRRRLVKQFGETLRAYGITSGVIMAGQSGATRCPVVVGCRDSFARWLANERDFDRPDLVIIDEAHKSLASVYQTILDRYRAAHVIGLTATPARDDGKSMGDFYQWLECTVPASQLIAEGWLIKPEVFAPLELADRRRKGEMVKGLAGDPVAHWLDHAAGLPTVAFAARNTEAEDLADRFNAAGIPAQAISGEADDEPGWDGKSERDRVYDKLAAGEVKVLCSVGLLVEGVDIPEVSAAIIWSKFGSVVKWRQACLDQQTEVLTKQGWSGIGEVTETDEVASFDPATGGIEWCHPTNIFDRPIASDESMYAVRNPHLDIRVTNDHTMVYRCQGETAVRWHKKSAANLASMGSKVRIPVAGIEDAAGLPLTVDDLHFIGWFMTDGSLDKSNRVITLSQSSASPYVEHIKRCLRGCNFRYGVYERVRTGQWVGYAPGLEFHISYGKPQKKVEQHMTGWSRLEPYLSRDFHPNLEGLSREQLGTVLEAMNWGNGTKPKNISWTQHTMRIGTGNKTLADRLQSLCVRRGFACNINTQGRGQSRAIGTKPYYTLSIRPGATSRTVWAQELVPVESSPGDRVWCMTAAHGTLVTRRNGRVAIVGNCGRTMRPCLRIGKSRAVILDHAGAAGEHGLPGDDVEWSLDLGSTVGSRREKAIEEGRQQATVICDKCGLAYAALPACPNCGRAAPRPARRQTLAEQYQASRDAVLERFDGDADRDFARERDQRAWAQAIGTAIKRNGKARQAAGIFRGITGKWPEEAGVGPLPASRAEWDAPAAEVWPQFVRRRAPA